MHELTRSTLLGAAVGDAFGVPFEFLGAVKFADIPLDKMLGADVEPVIGSHWGTTIPAGAWSDDTSMAVATMESIAELGTVDPTDIMNRFVAWWEDGQYCAVEKPFGLGKTVARALGAYLAGQPVLASAPCRRQDNGNGALMRIFPFALFCHGQRMGCEERMRVIQQASAITHGHEISQMSCVFFCEFLHLLFEGADFGDAFNDVQGMQWSDHFDDESVQAHARILDSKFGCSREELSPTGFVVDTLEIAVYCLLTTSSYEAAIKTAVRFGGDTDTYAAIAGAAAGARYGLDGIPVEWLAQLKRHEYLVDLAERFAAVARTR